MRVAEAVIGASGHYARAELVTLAAEDGVPVFLDRRRVELIPGAGHGSSRRSRTKSTVC